MGKGEGVPLDSCDLGIGVWWLVAEGWSMKCTVQGDFLSKTAPEKTWFGRRLAF